jgi:glycine/D-amino acid oxidase-like deaminating enzyme
MIYDYFIVGQGIAGSVMARLLGLQGKTRMVFESPEPNTSSTIAAGLMNPVTGKRMTLSWMAGEMFPEARSFYTAAEKDYNAHFYFPMPVYRIFSSVGEQNDWLAKLHEERYQSFIGGDALESLNTSSYINPYDSMRVEGGGRLQVSAFIDAVKRQLLNEGCWQEQLVNLENLVLDEDVYRIGNYRAHKVIFCTGYDPVNWSFLPFTPMKGEVLQVKSESLDRDKITVGACFVSPIQGDRFYAGATYNWRTIDTEITEEGKQEILSKLGKFLRNAPEVVEHKAGIRPAVKDRRPMLGEHPGHKNIYLFSGLGSKGVSMAPYLARHLIEHIEEGRPLMPEIDLKRFL